MRFSNLCLTAAAVALAAAVSAQPAGEPATESEPRLSDLQETVDQLLDEENEPTAPEPEVQSEAEEAAAEEPEPTPEDPAAEPPAPESVADSPNEAAPSPPAPPLTRAEIATVERIAERGRLLIEIARAGIIATRDMLSRVSDPDGAGIVGWIAEPGGNAVEVTFYAEGDAGPRAVYRTTVLGGRVTSRETYLGGARPELSPIQARMAAARAAASALDHEACTTQPFNVLVVPPASADSPIDVYQVSTPAERGRFPLGGHFRTTVAADGAVADSRAFTNACLEVEGGAPAEGETVRPIGVTHLLDPTPTEIHMFLAQLIGRPLLVATGEPQRVWGVTGDRIAEIRPQAN